MWWCRCNGAKAEQTLRQRVICFFFFASPASKTDGNRMDSVADTVG